MAAFFVSIFLSWGIAASPSATSFPPDMVREINDLKTVGAFLKAKDRRSPEMQALMEERLKGREKESLPKLRRIDSRTIEVGEGLRLIRVELGRDGSELIINHRHLDLTTERSAEDLWNEVRRAFPKWTTGSHWLWSAAWAQESSSNLEVMNAVVTEMSQVTATFFHCRDIESMKRSCVKFMEQGAEALKAGQVSSSTLKGMDVEVRKAKSEVDRVLREKAKWNLLGCPNDIQILRNCGATLTQVSGLIDSSSQGDASAMSQVMRQTASDIKKVLKDSDGRLLAPAPAVTSDGSK